MSDSVSLLSLSNVSKSYGDEHVLKNISLDIAEQSIVALIGKSGAGKSTLLRCLNGLEKPEQGSITFQGTDLTGLSEKGLREFRQKIGVISQKPNLLTSKTVIENVLFPQDLKGPLTQAHKNKAHDLLEIVGLSHLMDKYPSQLSGGQQQRTSIARALMMNTPLLLCDEFTSALDPQTTLDILKIIEKVRKTLGITILIVTHDMSVVKEVADSVYILDKGAIAESGPVSDVFSNPRADITKDLLKSIIDIQLPPFITDNIKVFPQNDTQALYQLHFKGKTTLNPIVADIMNLYGISLNILAGNIDHAGHTPYGSIVVSLPHDQENIEKIESYLRDKKITYQCVGYLD